MKKLKKLKHTLLGHMIHRWKAYIPRNISILIIIAGNLYLGSWEPKGSIYFSPLCTWKSPL